MTYFRKFYLTTTFIKRFSLNINQIRAMTLNKNLVYKIFINILNYCLLLGEYFNILFFEKSKILKPEVIKEFLNISIF